MGVSEPLIQASLLGEAAEHAPFAVLVADEEGRYVAVNQAACLMLGYSREELLRLGMRDVARYAEAAGEFALGLEGGLFGEEPVDPRAQGGGGQQLRDLLEAVAGFAGAGAA